MAEASSDPLPSTTQPAGLATTPSDRFSAAMDGQHQEMPSAAQNNPNSIPAPPVLLPSLPSQPYNKEASSSPLNHKLNTTHQPSQLTEQPPNSSSSSSQFPATTISSQGGVMPSQPRQPTQTDRDTIMGGAPEMHREQPPRTASESLMFEQVPSGAAGARARMYLNEKIVPFLLEAMKPLARNEPPNPLRLLGEALIAKSAEIGEPSNEQSSSTQQ